MIVVLVFDVQYSLCEWLYVRFTLLRVCSFLLCWFV
jgi:hypothetical protein